MEQPSRPSQVLRFGPFELESLSGELRKEGAKIRLQEQPLQVLLMLLEHPGQVITREQLRSKLWPADTFVDFDHGLNKAIQKLREALGDSAENPQFIETIAKRGYRLLQSPAAGLSEPSIAVLPFVNLSADSENEFFCDGTSEEIISALAGIKNLHVVARTSSFSFKGKHVDLRAVGQQLNVRTILEGSVRRSGDRLRITAQLVNAADGYQLWAEKYDREMKDVFAIQEEIANSIAQRLQVTLDSGRQPLFKAGTASLEAFRFYVQGRSLFFQRGVRLLPAVECFKKAVTLDPKYGLAWAGLADAYHMLAFFGLVSPKSCLSKARVAAKRALELDSPLAEAHASLAMSHLFFDWDGSGAKQEFLHALELKPHNALTRIWYGMFLLHWLRGNFEAGLEQVQQAVLIDPLSPYARAMLAFAYLTLDVRKSLEVAQETLCIDSDFFIARWAQLACLNLLDRFAEAAEVGEVTLRVSGRAAWVMGALARTYAALGKREKARALYMELLWRSKHEYVAPAVIGWAAWAAGERDAAIQLEQEADAVGDPSLIVARYWPDFAELREDSRFQKILLDRGWT